MKLLSEDIKKEFSDQFGPGRVKFDEPMAAHTYFRIGGPAQIYFEALTTDELVKAIKLAIDNKLPFTVIGGGANVLISDKGLPGLVVKNRAEGIKIAGIKGAIKNDEKAVGEIYVQAESGTSMNRLARFTIDEGLKGLEFLLSVPGTVGGGLKINSHFRPYLNEFIGNSVSQATLLDKEGNTRDVDGNYFNFGYDQSEIQNTGEIVLSAVFRLKRVADPHAMWEEATKQLTYRNETQPVGVACSGCVFRNFDHVDALRLATPLLTTSAGYLIERMGLKGEKSGNIQISDKHANYFINLGDGKSQDVMKLITMVKDRAKKEFGIELREEIFLMGED